MKHRGGIPLLFLACARIALALAPVPTTHLGRLKEDLLGVSPLSVEHLKARSWDPEKEDVPLSARKALALARRELTKVASGSESSLFACDEIRLFRDSSDWYYVVQFESIHPSVVQKRDSGGFYPAMIPFIVYLDGFVELPTKRKA